VSPVTAGSSDKSSRALTAQRHGQYAAAFTGRSPALSCTNSGLYLYTSRCGAFNLSRCHGTRHSSRLSDLRAKFFQALHSPIADTRKADASPLSKRSGVFIHKFRSADAVKSVSVAWADEQCSKAKGLLRLAFVHNSHTQTDRLWLCHSQNSHQAVSK